MPARNLLFNFTGTAHTNTLTGQSYDLNSCSISGVTSLTTGAHAVGYTAQTTTYAISATDSTIDCTGTFTATLPTAVGKTGQLYCVKNSGDGTITIATTSAQLIDDNSTFSVPPGSAVLVQSTGTGWKVESIAGPKPAKPLLICEGDSLTSGSWPVTVASNLPAWEVVDTAQGGQMVFDMLTDWRGQGPNYYNPARSNNVLVLWGGTNDCFNSWSAAVIQTRIGDYITQATAAGFQVLVCTIIANGALDVTKDGVRQTVNTWLRANHASRLIDLAILPQFDTLADTSNTTYYNVDTIHLTAASYAIITPLIQAAVLALPYQAPRAFGRVGADPVRISNGISIEPTSGGYSDMNFRLINSAGVLIGGIGHNSFGGWFSIPNGSLGGSLDFIDVNGASKFTITTPGISNAVWDKTNTAGGTTGARTINKLAGTVNFAAAATSLVVTNSYCTTSSLVFAVVRTNDTTATIKNVVPGSGSFTITLNAAATAETSVGFFLVI